MQRKRVAGLQGNDIFVSLLMSLPLDVNWDAIRIEFAHGVSIQTLANKYSISEGTLKARSSREKWVEMRPETYATNATGVLEAAKTAAIAGAASWAEKGERHRKMVFEKTTAMLEQATLAPPKNWKDAEIVDKMARRAAGLDNLETQVNTIIGLGSLDDAPVSVLEAEIVHDASLLDSPNEGETTG